MNVMCLSLLHLSLCSFLPVPPVLPAAGAAQERAASHGPCPRKDGKARPVRGLALLFDRAGSAAAGAVSANLPKFTKKRGRISCLLLAMISTRTTQVRSWKRKHSSFHRKQKEKKDMASNKSSNSNKIMVPQARAAMNKFKMEAANASFTSTVK